MASIRFLARFEAVLRKEVGIKHLRSLFFKHWATPIHLHDDRLSFFWAESGGQIITFNFNSALITSYVCSCTFNIIQNEFALLTFMTTLVHFFLNINRIFLEQTFSLTGLCMEGRHVLGLILTEA